MGSTRWLEFVKHYRQKQLFCPEYFTNERVPPGRSFWRYTYQRDYILQSLGKMMEYEFTLKYQLSEVDCSLEELVEQLGAGSCNDALLGIGQPGRIEFKFTRDAPSKNDAIESAISDISNVMPKAIRIYESAAN